jgi:hypothetical protein
LKDVEKEINGEIKMIIYKMVYLALLLSVSESWPLPVRCESGFAGAEMRYCSKQEERK